MTDEMIRRSNGQFMKGVSGNREGARRRRIPQLLSVEDLNNTVLKVAGGRLTTASGETINRYEACVRALASGSAKNRLAAKAFIDLTTSAARSQEALKRRREEEERRRRLAQRHY